MKIWSTLNHKNVLPLLGYFIEGGEFPNFISTWMENGSLFDYIKLIPDGIETFSLVSFYITVLMLGIDNILKTLALDIRNRFWIDIPAQYGCNPC